MKTIYRGDHAECDKLQVIFEARGIRSVIFYESSDQTRAELKVRELDLDTAMQLLDPIRTELRGDVIG